MLKVFKNSFIKIYLIKIFTIINILKELKNINFD